MTVAITPEHNHARLSATLAFLDTGSAPARLRIYSGARPEMPWADPMGELLVEIRLSKPAGTIGSGLLTLTQQENGLIVASGIASWARLVNGDDVAAMDLDCSDTDAGGDIQLISLMLYLGGDARMVSAILS